MARITRNAISEPTMYQSTIGQRAKRRQCSARQPLPAICRIENITMAVATSK